MAFKLSRHFYSIIPVSFSQILRSNVLQPARTNESIHLG